MRKNPLTTLLLAFSFLLGPLHADETAESNAQLLREALFAEEAERDLAKAEQGYREIVKNFDTDRVYAATAILRLAEILHQRGDTAEAEKWFARVLREFPDQEALVKVATARLGDKAAGLARVGPVPIDPQVEEIARLTKLLEQSPDLLNTPIDGTTPLATAAAKGQLDVVNFLLTKGAKVNGDDNFPSALSAAVSEGHLAIVERLIKAATKLEPDLVNKSVQSGNYAVTEQLLKAGAPANTRGLITLNSKSIFDSLSGTVPLPPRDRRPEHPHFHLGSGGIAVRWTPLETAVYFRFSKLTDLLIAHGAKSQTVSGTYTEELRFAIIDQNIELVAKLLKNGADPNSQWGRPPVTLKTAPQPRRPRQPQKLSALSLAAAVGNVEMTKRLIKAGAKVNLVEEPAQTTPLHSADTATIAILIAAGANPNVKDQEGNSLLHLGLNAAKLEILIAAGADLNALNNEGKTPLIKAVENLRADLVTALIKAGANPNGIPNNPAPLAFLPNQSPVKRSPPMPTDYGPVIRALVDAGADPNAVDQSNVTALMRAASSDDLETVRYLLEKGAALEVAGKFAYGFAPDDSPTERELFLKTYQQPERRRGTIRVVFSEKGIIHEEVAALVQAGNDLPLCPYSLLEAYVFSNPDYNFALGGVTIWREGHAEALKFDLRKIVASGDPKEDVDLAWGDLIQFSFAKSREETAVNLTEKKFLEAHLNRQVNFTIDGKTNKIDLSLEWERLPNFESWIRAKLPREIVFASEAQRMPLLTLKKFSSLDIILRDNERYRISRVEVKRNGQKFELQTPILWPEAGDTIFLY